MTTKTLFFIISLLFLTESSFAETRTVKMLGPVAINTAAVTYGIPEGSVVSTTESARSRPLTSTGTFSNLRVKLSAAPANGAGTQTVTVALRIAGAGTALTCVISEAETTCNDLTHEATGTAGQLVSFSITPANTPAASNIELTYQYVDSIPNYSWNIVGSGGASVAPTTIYYAFANNGGSSIAGYNQMPMPTSGTIRNLYCQLSAAPDNGGGTQSWIHTFRKDGVDQTVTCTVSEAATTCNDTTHSFTFVAGEKIQLSQAASNTPASSTISCAATFQPDVEGEFLLGAGFDTALSTSATQYRGVESAASWNATESAVDQISLPFTIKGFYTFLDGAPDNGGGTQSYTLTIRDDGVSTGHSCVMSEAATSCNDVDAGVNVVIDSQMSVQQVPSGTPTARLGYSGILGYNKPRRIVRET